MCARVVSANVEPSRLNEAIELWQTNVAPSARSQAGFRGARLFVNRDSGDVLSMGLWESQAHFEATVQWNRGQLAMFAELLIGERLVRGFELAAESLSEAT
ncbi:MAG TPA: antibiotic biosynthesis monooxygenase [Dehalococcoidia bacterium]|nr:antibiotic biosynthesis monooxygenase [Dehalococcoidia bacterium]